MKTSISYSLIAAAMACGFANGQTTAYTTPVGYVTQALAADQFNLVGTTVQQSTAAAGVIDAVTSISVTDNGVNFTTTLTAGTVYVLELNNGTIQEITSWSGSVLTTPSNLVSQVTAGTTAYKIRPAATISSIFGAANSAGLTPSPDGSTGNADTIQVYNGSGFDTIVYINDGAGTEGWYTETGDPAANLPIVYADGFFVKRTTGSGPINLVVSGEIKTVPTSGVLTPGFNYLGAVAPVGLTLATSGLSSYISPSPDGDAATSDSVQIQVGGAYVVCMYIDGIGWYSETGDPVDNQVLNTGFLIQNRGTTKPYTVSVPSSYSSL